MKIAYFDCEFGAAGDMLVGALIAAGVPIEHINSELGKLNLPATAFELGDEKVIRCSIQCSKFNVLTGPGKDYEDGLYPSSSAASVTPSGSNPNRLKWSQISTSSVDVVDETVALCPRTLEGIIKLLTGSALPTAVNEHAARIFEIYFNAEATCQGLQAKDLLMNELMALDAIIDITSFAIAYAALGIEKSFVSPLPLGTGTFPYGEIYYSALAPSTAQVLKEAGAPISPNKFHNECLTVTGAAILASVATGWSVPAMKKIIGTGYGAGSYDPPAYPNACRLLIGIAPNNLNDPFEATSNEAVDSRFSTEDIVVMEANIDDLSPQSLAYAMERLFEGGALDVLVLPAVMKKGRSGHLLKVLCQSHLQQKLQEIIFNETSTIGIRYYLAHRVIAERRWHEVSLLDGAVIRIKVALDQSGTIIHSQPEYEDCAAYAQKHGIPLKRVSADAIAKFNEQSS